MKPNINETSSLSFPQRVARRFGRGLWTLFKPLFSPVIGHFYHQTAQTAELIHVVKNVATQISVNATQTQASLYDFAARLDGVVHPILGLAERLDTVTRDVTDVRAKLERVTHRIDDLQARSDQGANRVNDLAMHWALVAQQISRENDTNRGMFADASARLSSVEHLIRHIEATSVSRFDYLEADRNIFRQLNAVDARNVAQRIRAIGKLLRAHTAVDRRKVRLGGAADGGYVCLDDFHEIKTALSFGIDRNVSWDLAVASEGLVVHQFDHTVAGPPMEHSNFRFNKSKISPRNNGEEESIGSILASRGLNEPASVVLKIDIEGDEWDVFDAATAAELGTFSQIICEFHGFQFVENDDFYKKFVRVLSKIGNLFRVVHVHGNNFCPMFMLGGVPFPSLLEVTYVNARRCKFVDSTEIFPTPLDRPNNPTRPDFFLGNFTF